MKIEQKISMVIVLAINFYTLFIIYNYWQADVYYNKSKLNNDINSIEKAINMTSREPIFISHLAYLNTNIRIANEALILSPYNQNIRKVLASNLVKDASKNPDSLSLAEKVFLDGISISPYDPKLHYQLGLTQLRLDKYDAALSNLEKAVELKPNYKEGRFALGVTYIDFKDYPKAMKNLEYILNYIDPNDELTKKYLDQAKSASK